MWKPSLIYGVEVPGDGKAPRDGKCKQSLSKQGLGVCKSSEGKPR